MSHLGTRQHLDYLVELGIGAVWFNPIYKSPMKDFGYDVSNYVDIDPLFGTLEDFEILLSEMHKKGKYSGKIDKAAVNGKTVHVKNNKQR